MPSSTQNLVLTDDLYMQLTWQTDEEGIVESMRLMLQGWKAS